MIDEKLLIENIQQKISPERYGRVCNPLDVIYGVLQVIDEQPKVGEWIPCSERLPAYDYDYFNEYGEDREYIVMIKRATAPTNLYFDGNEWYDDIYRGYKVVAWQPLPEPWEEM